MAKKTISIPYFQVDAFTSERFHGNPAAVVITDQWLKPENMLKIAEENNLSETAFLVKNDEGYDITWYTPVHEVDLCGHATLASAFVLFEEKKIAGKSVKFRTQSVGPLEVFKTGDQFDLDLPADKITMLNVRDNMEKCFGTRPMEAYSGKSKLMLVFKNQQEIKDLIPDLNAISKLEASGVIATAPGDSCDFVSRFFAPKGGVNEDPVTGSAHTLLTPYWANRLGKTVLQAQQLSQRTGSLTCEWRGDRVIVGGKAIMYAKGEFYL